MPTDRSHQLITLPDGRLLCFAEFGDPDGFPVLGLHGTPGCRLDRWPEESVYADAGVRLITYDRPGYGGSDRLAGRRVVHCVDDVRHLLDHLGIDEFSVTGGSGGGPHALAVAARLGERIRRAQCNVGIVPYGTPDFDWFAGMDPMNVKEFGLALEGEDALRVFIESELDGMRQRIAEGVEGSALMSDEWELSDADLAVLARPELAEGMRESELEMCRQGPDGWIDDSLCFADTDWGFSLDEIAIPVKVTYGKQDVLVPAAHGAWLAANVPHAIEDARDGEGHMGDPDQVSQRLAWLVGGGMA